MTTGRTAFRLLRYRPRLFLGTILFRGIDDLAPFATGLIMKAFFDTLTGDAPAGLTAWTLVALYFVLEVGDRGVLFAAAIVGARWRFTVESLLRKNLLTAALAVSNPPALSDASGETTNRFRDDVEGVVEYLETYIHLWGNMVFAALAIAWMARIDVTVNFHRHCRRCLPPVHSAFPRRPASRYRGSHQLRKRDVPVRPGPPGGHCRGLGGEPLSPPQRPAPQVDPGGQSFQPVPVLHQLQHQSPRHRGHPHPRGRADAQRRFLRRGLCPFVMAQHRRAEVSLERMSRTIEAAGPAPLVEYGSVFLSGAFPPKPASQPTSSQRLRQLETRGLTCVHGDSDNGVYDVNLRLEAGSFTVITGRIGCGKTTLVRALLGVLPLSSGEIYWNGSPVEDPKVFLVPPRCAYTPQVPRLFSETLRDNILLGLPEEEGVVANAVSLGVMEDDLKTLERGLETVVGPRGVKLSGGQIQRTAAARMFARDAELYVFDDLSSALDVETERTLWERLAKAPDQTCLVVSHRRAALQRADRIVLLKEGRVEAMGTLEELLAASEEMRHIWRGDSAGTPHT